MNVNEMTLGEVFGYCMASRGVTNENNMVEVVSALVDTTRQATDGVADLARTILYDFLDGAGYGYMKYLTENTGEYVSNTTGEVVTVTMIP